MDRFAVHRQNEAAGGGAVLLSMARRAHGARSHIGRGSRIQSLDTVMVGWRALPAHALVEFELRHRPGGTRGVMQALIELEA